MRAAAIFICLLIVGVSVLSLFERLAHADGIECGPTCTFTWTAGTGPTPTGYKLYIGGVSNDPSAIVADVGNVQTVKTDAVNIVTPGQYYARVTGYNTVGESEFSNEVPFVLVTLVPGAPSLSVE